jgi:hypothetical protein
MLANNIPPKLPSVERLVQRAMAAEKSQQKEVRITVQEIHELTAELAIVTSKLGKTITDIHNMLVEIKNSSSNSGGVSGSFDGGTF